MSMMLLPGGRERTRPEWDALLARAGFEITGSFPSRIAGSCPAIALILTGKLSFFLICGRGHAGFITPMMLVTPVIFLLPHRHAGMGEVVGRFHAGRYEHHYFAGARDCGPGGCCSCANRCGFAGAEGCARAGDYALAVSASRHKLLSPGTAMATLKSCEPRTAV